jgi:dihydroorotate dehydrogenase (NAD+) catalytic subunit
VIASGGASTAEDVLEFIVSGASAVQIGTASFRRPNAISEIASDLRRILEQEKLSLDELRGTLVWPH